MPLERPFISADHVQAVLDALLYATARPASANPLATLLLVDEFLTNPDLPPVSNPDEMALHQIVVNLIHSEWSANRQAVGLKPGLLPTSVEEAAIFMEEDAIFGVELIGWSLLFFRYVCVNLNLSPDFLADYFHVDPRTLRRYHNHAIRRLTDRLTFYEWEARIRQRKRRLYINLPASVPTPLLGRDNELATLARYLDLRHTHHIVLTGVPGIGKTVLAQEFVRGLVDGNQLDQLVWIERPSSVSFVRQQLIDTLLQERMQISLRDFLHLNQVAVVLDDAEAVLHSPEALAHLLVELAPALIVLTGSLYVPVETPHLHLRLPELSRPAARSLILQTVGQELHGEGDALNELASGIWRVAGGNPLATILLTRNTELLDGAGALGDVVVVQRLFGRAYASLDRRLKRAWYAFALFPPGDVPVQTLEALWPTRLQRADVVDLIQRHLIERVSLEQSTCALMTAARRFLEAIYRTDPEAAEVVGELIADLDGHIDDQVDEARIPARYLLRTDWPELSPDMRQRWRRTLWDDPNVQNQLAEWRTILEYDLEQERPDDIDLQIAYALCLRQGAQWAEAQVLLERAARQAGMKGDFVTQARCLIELSVVLRYRGDYAACLTHLASAERFARRYNHASLREAVALEYANVAVERRDPVMAYQYLDDLPPSARSLTIKAEACLLAGDYDQLYEAVDQALVYLDPADEGGRARMQVLLGRAYEQQNDLERARDSLAAAVLYLERSDDAFALARARSSLGAVALRLRRYAEARALLTQAEAVQHALGDELGLIVTRNNLLFLQARQAGDD